MRISILNEAAPVPGRLNEDSCGVYADGDRLALFVADGAGQRTATTRTAGLFARYGENTTAARFAALLVRDTFERRQPQRSPAAILREANTALRQLLAEVYGELTPAALRQHEPGLAPYIDEDPRLFRMALPACVATAAEIDMRRGQLEYAHAGDTCLLLFNADGAIIQPTADQMGSHDEAALRLARQIQIERGAPHLADVLDDPRVIEANWRNGLYHNYVDARGQPDLGVGVAVINGLPELDSYVQTGTIDLTGVQGVLVCSDGFLWPAPLGESIEGRQARYQVMRKRIERDGLRGYYAALRQTEAADSTRDQYPRFKIHDDCTAVYVEF